MFSIFHAAVSCGKTHVVEKLLEADSGSKACLNIPVFDNRNCAIFPITTAIERGNYDLAVLLMGYGALISLTAEDLEKAKNMR